MCIYLCELCVHVYIAWLGVCVCVCVCVCVSVCVSPIYNHFIHHIGYSSMVHVPTFTKFSFPLQGRQ